MEEKHQKRLKEVRVDWKERLSKLLPIIVGLDRQEAVPQRATSAE